MKSLSLALFAFVSLFIGTSSIGFAKELPVVSHVDLNRYMGKWYEIASFEQRFSKNCVASTANYTLKEDGEVTVVNECRDKTFDGKLRRAVGRAWVTDTATNAKLKVQFFRPFSGKYWIIDLGPNYEYSVVSHPSMKYLWILSRTPKMDQATYEDILVKLLKMGFDLSYLNKTPQP